MEKSQPTRNLGLDAMRLLCAFFVVCIHTSTPWDTEPITRLAVPCFFMLSGFYLYGGDVQSKIVKSLKKTAVIFLYSSLFFILYRFALQYFFHAPGPFFTPKWAAFMLFAGRTEMIAFHLWYLLAFIQTLIFAYFVNKFNLWKPTWIAVPFIIIATLVLGCYNHYLLDINLSFGETRNWITFGLVFVFIGALMRKNIYKIDNSRLLSNNVFNACMIAVFAATSIIELRLIRYDGYIFKDIFASTYPLAIFTFLFFKNIKSNSKWLAITARLAKEHSLNIYIMHLIFILGADATHDKIPEFCCFYTPVVTFTATFILSIIFNKIKSTLTAKQ